MSVKGRRNRAWEDENLTGWFTPFRLVLRAFSSIPLAIVLLVYISLHATLASVPVGMIARIPTLLVYAASFVAVLAIGVFPTIILARKVMGTASRGVRFVVGLVATVAVAGACVMLWSSLLWPVMRHRPETGEGLLLFSDFVHRYRSTTIRRLPSMEMTETAFYAWWPMRLALVLFVINMVTATIRRIEFTFKNLGVLTVHTGIVTIALGSVFYQKFKLEGDTLLMASQSAGVPGPPATVFYDREDVVLYVADELGWDGRPRWEQRPIARLPRYNDYNTNAGVPDESQSMEHLLAGDEHEAHTTAGADRPLDIEPRVPTTPPDRELLIDPDIKFRIVGYTPFAEQREDWYKISTPSPSIVSNPMRVVELYAALPGTTIPEDKAVRTPLIPAIPAQRIVSRPGIAMEYTVGMDDTRWEDLQVALTTEFMHALVIEVPETGFRTVVPASPGALFTLGDTGWGVGVKSIHQEPPFPIITKGYENATSSMMIVEIHPPPHSEDEATTDNAAHMHNAFDRWVYHRFPAINQDLHPSATGRPLRTDANPAIRVSYIDASMLQIYMDERPDGTVRSIIRQPGGRVVVHEAFDGDWLRDIVPNDQGGRVDLKLGARWDHAERISHPVPLPAMQRDATFGEHIKGFIAVEVSTEKSDWSKIIWVPFSRYDPVSGLQTRDVFLPDGQKITLGFGRQQRPLPGFHISLMDFQMIAYDHRGAPRDYQSIVRVDSNPAWGDRAAKIEPYDHLVKLNNPLRAPFHWDPNKSWVFNSVRRLSAGMNPNQFKLSQNGWDRAGWQQSQQLVDEGKLDKPRANFTILGVGNNPGIHLVALGSIFMAVGIPWAFYVKPWLLKREKARIVASLATKQTKSTA